MTEQYNYLYMFTSITIELIDATYICNKKATCEIYPSTTLNIIMNVEHDTNHVVEMSTNTFS